jgi:hypothetical protein
MAGIKLSEQAILLYTSADAARAPAAAGLAAAADGLIKQLTELLKEPDVEQQPGPVVIGAMKALGAVCMQRGQLMAKALPSLLALANKVRRCARIVEVLVFCSCFKGICVVSTYVEIRIVSLQD